MRLKPPYSFGFAAETLNLWMGCSRALDFRNKVICCVESSLRSITKAETTNYKSRKLEVADGSRSAKLAVFKNDVC